MEMRIDVITELERAGFIVQQQASQPSWVTVKCPFHADNTPSCAVNVDQHAFKCHSCGASGELSKLFARHLNQPQAIILLDWDKRYGSTVGDNPVDPQVVEEYHSRIWQAGVLRQRLYDRGLTDLDIREHRLGEYEARIRIPVANARGIWVNIISYRPGAPEKKFLNMRGRGTARVYPYSQLEFPKLLLCGGPIKAIAAARQLNQHGIGCICSTGGEQYKNWPKDLLQVIGAGKREWVGVCLDIDATGVKSAKELADMLARSGQATFLLHLPLDPDKYPKGDVNDYIGAERGNLIDVCNAAQPHVYKGFDGLDSLYDPKKVADAKPVTIGEAAKANTANRRLEYRSLVSMIEAEAYYLPKIVKPHCDKQQELCSVCPLLSVEDNADVLLDPESDALLEIVNSARKDIPTAIKRSLGVPPCKSVRFKVTEHYHAQHAILTQDLDSGAVLQQPVQLHAVTVDSDVELNETYAVTGRVMPHPKTQRATAVVSKASPVKDTLSTSQVNPELLIKLQPQSWTLQGIHRKLETLYSEFEDSVTRIYERRDLHLLIDLAYHSVLFFPADGRIVKGWVEVLAVGDSSQGKTETAVNIMRHYGLGQKVDCKNASAAGLLGGVQNINGRHYISWGVMPLNDRRLILFEELKGASPEVIAKLTDARSSGIAEIPKIEHKKAHCRVRMVALSNPRSDLPVAAYSYGVEVIRELIPNLEDVRRFDAICVMSKDDVSLDVTQYGFSPEGHAQPAKQQYTSEVCRAGVLWGWTRSPGNIKFADWQSILTKARDLTEEFTDAIPIVDRGSMRFKVARLAIALAVRTFSHGEHADGTPDYETVLVRACHAEYIAEFLRRLYRAPAFGYDRFTRSVRETSSIRQPEAVIRKLTALPYPVDFAECALRTTEIDLRDVCDWCGWDRVEATELVSMLVRNRALIRDGRGYRKAPALIEILNKISVDPALIKLRDTPQYAKGGL